MCACWCLFCRISLILLLICGCAKSVAPVPARTEGNHKHVFIVHDAWHAGIVIRTIDIPPAVLPEVNDFPSAEYLEFSWGDKDYFPAPDPGIGLALKAAFWSSGSVLQVFGSNGSLENAFPGAKILEIGLSKDGFQRLISFISDTFSRPSQEAPVEARPGLSPNARFYPAEGKFSILRTCNTWVAEALSAAGLPVSPRYVITAGSLDRQVRALDGK